MHRILALHRVVADQLDREIVVVGKISGVYVDIAFNLGTGLILRQRNGVDDLAVEHQLDV